MFIDFCGLSELRYLYDTSYSSVYHRLLVDIMAMHSISDSNMYILISLIKLNDK